MQKNESAPHLPFPLMILIPIWIIALASLGVVMFYSGTIFLWVFCSFFLFVLLDSSIMKLRLRGVPTSLAAVFMVVGAVILGTTLVSLMVHFSAIMLNDLEEARKVILQYYDSFGQFFRTWFENLTHNTGQLGPGLPIEKAVQKVEVIDGSPISVEWRTTLMHGLGSAVTVLTFACLIPILTFFMAAERDWIVEVFPERFASKGNLKSIWKKIEVAVKAYFLGNLVLGAVTFPLFAILFLIFEVKSPFTMAFLASIFNLIPFLGAILAGFFPFVSLLGQGNQLVAAVILYSLCAAIHFVVANFVTPKVLGSRVNLNATTSTIALIVWGELWGGMGLILAIPITATIKIFLEHSSSQVLMWIAALMSESKFIVSVEGVPVNATPEDPDSKESVSK